MTQEVDGTAFLCLSGCSWPQDSSPQNKPLVSELREDGQPGTAILPPHLPSTTLQSTLTSSPSHAPNPYKA